MTELAETLPFTAFKQCTRITEGAKDGRSYWTGIYHRAGIGVLEQDVPSEGQFRFVNIGSDGLPLESTVYKPRGEEGFYAAKTVTFIWNAEGSQARMMTSEFDENNKATLHTGATVQWDPRTEDPIEAQVAAMNRAYLVGSGDLPASELLDESALITKLQAEREFATAILAAREFNRGLPAAERLAFGGREVGA